MGPLSALGMTPLFTAAGQLSGGALSFTDSLFELGRQAGNKKVMPYLPSVEAMMRAYACGTIDDAAARFGFEGHGVQLLWQRADEDGPKRNALWSGCYESSLFYYNPDEIVELWLRGIINAAEFVRMYRRAGGSQAFVGLAKKANKGRYPLDMIMDLWRRGYLSPTQAADEFKRTTAFDQFGVSQLGNLKNALPPPSDLIRMAVREVFNPQLVADLQLSAEYTDNPELKLFANAQGLGRATVIDDNGNEHALDVPLAYWQAHWVQPSSMQYGEMYHRIRPDRVARFAVQFPGIKPFALDDLKRGLKVNDYAPSVRDWMGAINTRPLGVRDIKAAYRWDAIDLDEVVALYQDLGYTKDDATVSARYIQQMTKVIKERDDEREALRKHGKSIKGVVKAYRSGALEYLQAYTKITAFGLDEKLSQDLLDEVDLDVQTKLLDAYVRAVKGEYFLGLYSPSQAIVELESGGLTARRAAQFVRLWSRQLSRPRRVANATRIIDWVRRGLLDTDSASRRLATLGWSNEDTILWLAQGEQDIEKDRLKAALAAERDEERRQAKLTALLDREERKIRQIKADYEKHSSPAYMAKWLRDREINPDEVSRRLTFLGWPPDDINRYLQEAMANA